MSAVASPLLIEVEEGDILTLNALTGASNIIEFDRTFLTVQTIE